MDMLGKAALFPSPHGQAKSASALTNILPMPLLAVSFSLDPWSFLSIAWPAGGPGGGGWSCGPLWVFWEASEAAGVFSRSGHDAP